VSSYTVVKLDEIEETTDGRCPWRAIRHHLGIQAFGINSWTARDAGDRLINEHGEEGDDGDEELYVVLGGHATFEVGDEDERARRRVDLLTVDLEGGVTVDDDVQLLVLRHQLGVLADDRVAGLLGLIRVGAEGPDPEVLADREPGVSLLDVVQMRCSVAHKSSFRSSACSAYFR